MFGSLIFAWVPFATVGGEDMSGNPWVVQCKKPADWKIEFEVVKHVRRCKHAT